MLEASTAGSFVGVSPGPYHGEEKHTKVVLCTIRAKKAKITPEQCTSTRDIKGGGRGERGGLVQAQSMPIVFFSR